MKSRRHFGWILATLLTVLVPSMSLFAQDQNSAGSSNNDPPARVARIQYISGEVSMQPGGVNDWVAANLNRPLTSSDRVWTDKDSRAELNVGTGYLRMDSETSLTLTNVGDTTVQAQLDQGILELTVVHLEPGEIYEIDTPNLAFTVMKPGVYRFEVRPNDDQTWVTVRKGNGQATGRGSAVKIGEGQQIRFSGQDSLQHSAYAAPAPDGFDDWVKVRDQRLNNSVSARYVAPGVIGYQDLDANGTWRVVPTYGAIWVPTAVPVGWAPYRFGRWVWIAPWGWTWVDNAAWGFAPFHYGRWVFAGGFWGWSPGPVFVGWRPFFAPALVGWVGGPGWGFGVSFGFGFGGGCGWFPLGWGEPFYPWYRGFHGGFVSQTYIRNVNVTNTHITNITNVTHNYYNNTINNTHYANRNVVGAVTAAPKSALASGQNIAKVGTVVPRSELGKGQVVRNIDVSPTKAAVLGGNTARNTATPPRSAIDRPVVTHTTPPVRQANPMAEGHNIPQAPATLSGHNSNSAQSAGIGQTANQGVHSSGPNTPIRQAEAVPPTHSVPRPPERYAGASTPTASGNSSPTVSSHVVPKPPYAGGPAPHETAQAERTSSGNPSGHMTQPPHQTTTATRPPASSTHSEQPSKQRETNTTKEAPKGNPGMASTPVPRPPAGYSYHAAPAYSSSSYAGNNSSYGGSSRSYSAPATGYRSSGGSYAYSAPTYRGGGSYGSAPTYSAHVTAPQMPHYSAPSAPHYSGSAGGGHYSGGGGGGSSHASSGHSGGHSR